MRSSGRIALLLVAVAGLWLAANPLLPPDSGPLDDDRPGARAPGASADTLGEPPSAPETERRLGGLDAESVVPRSRPDSAPPERTTRSEGAREGRPSPMPDGEPARDGLDLDGAPAELVRRALQQAIEDERGRRALHVAPSLVDAVATDGTVRVIFDTGIAAGSDEARLASRLSGERQRAAWDDLRIFPLLGHGAARVGPQALLHLIETDFVQHIELDAVHRPSLDETLPIVQADLAHQAGHDGEGLAIAILDTGVDGDHPMLAGRVVDEACFSLLGDCPNGETEMLGPGAGAPCTFGCGHGTRVAGIAAGADDGGGLVGIAPAASLVSIQIFSEVGGSPGAYGSDILAGLQHVLALTAFYDVAAANLSLGGVVYTSEETCDQSASAQRSAVALLRDAGVATVAAAGNEGITNGLSAPGCLSNVISVGSTSNADVPSSFTNSASFLSFFAPGQAVTTSANGGGTSSGSGTSLATPHVAGAVAAIRESAPNAGVGEIESALALSGLPVLDSRNGVTVPRIRIRDAIDLLSLTLDEETEPVASAGEEDDGGTGGGSGSCGLIGLEPWIVVAAVHVVRRRHSGRPDRGAVGLSRPASGSP